LILTAKGNISALYKREVDGFYHLKYGVTPESGSPHFILAGQVFNPPHDLGGGDIAKATLSDREV